MKHRIVLGIATLLVLGQVANVRADIVNYGDFFAEDVAFFDVTEVTPTSCLFFGAPMLVDEGLFFPATTTEASSSTSSNGGFDFRNAALSVTLQAEPGKVIDEVRIRHFGTISTFGDDSTAQVDSTGFATVGTEVFSSSFSVESSGNQIGGQFDETYTINVPDTESLVLSIQDQLFSLADSSAGFAFVNTQGIIIETFSITAVPEPGVGIGLALLIGCCWMQRRKRPVS